APISTLAVSIVPMSTMSSPGPVPPSPAPTTMSALSVPCGVKEKSNSIQHELLRAEQLTKQSFQLLVSLENIETHLSKLGLVLDSVLLLRLLLHKLSWDLGLVSKKRNVTSDHTHKHIHDPRAHSSQSLGGNIR
ncbi:hypothetical protein PENTCL1PPCAC_27979, partial [Pristionchus entomophagus]